MQRFSLDAPAADRAVGPARKPPPPTLVGFARHQEAGLAIVGTDTDSRPTRRLPALDNPEPTSRVRGTNRIRRRKPRRDRRLRVWLVWLGLAAAASTTVFLVGRTRTPAPPPVATAKTGAVGARLVGIGRLEAVPFTPVPAPEPGVVSRILVEPGDSIEQGQPLVRLTRPQALLEQRHEERLVRRLRRALGAAQDRVRQMQVAFGHEPRLGDMIETARRAAALARARLEAARRAVERGRTRLPATDVMAPHEGFVARIEARALDAVLAGTAEQPGEPLLWLARAEDLQLVAEMEPAAFGQIKAGLAARVIFLDGNAVRARAVVADVEGQLRRRPDGSQALGVRLQLEGPLDARELRPGLAARVEITAAREALLVPKQAVQETAGQPTVVAWSETRQTFQPRPVVLGTESRQLVEILAGLEPGTRVRTWDAETNDRNEAPGSGPRDGL